MSPRFKVLGGLAATAVLAGAGLLVFVASASTEAVTRTACGPLRESREATATLRVVGTRIEDSDGNPFVPYGVAVVSGPSTVNWAATEKAVAAQIIAAHRYWHANTVRIESSEQQLFANPTPGRGFNTRYAASVDRLVCLALTQGQIPVVNDATLFTAPKQHGPTTRTIRFWEFMSERYGDRFPVIFDLYNEPKLSRDPHTRALFDPGVTWGVWQSGGKLAGSRYVGMQKVVDAIRVKKRVENVIWVEEPYYLYPHERHTEMLPQHLLRGSNIVYAFHKSTLEPNSVSWRLIRDVEDRGIPLVDSEWSQFAADNRPWECLDGAYKTAPGFLEFLRKFPIGVLGWSLQPGALVQGIPGTETVHDGNDTRYTTDPRRLSAPNEMNPDYGCTAAARGQGVGRLLQNYFARYSKRPSTALFPKFG